MTDTVHRPTQPGTDPIAGLADRVLVLDGGRIGVDLGIELAHPRSYRDRHLADYRDQLLSALGVVDDVPDDVATSGGANGP